MKKSQLKFTLRSLRRSDAVALRKNIDHPIIHRNTLRLPKPYTLREARKWIEKNIREARKKKPRFITFNIDIGGELVGAVGVSNIEYGHKAEIGYWLARKFWGRGLMPQAVREVTQFCFNTLRLKRVYAYVFVFNHSSMRVLEKCGFKREALMRYHVRKGTKIIDEYVFAKFRR